MKKIAAVFLIVVLVLVGAGLPGCNKKEQEQQVDQFDRKAMLTNIADNIVVPSFNNFAEVFAAMNSAADAFSSSPDAQKLSVLRDRWKAAYIAWQQVELFGFGPAETISLRNYFNIYPTDVDLMRSYISSGDYNLEQLSNNKVQGFPALDYLLNGSGSSDDDILQNFTTNPDAAKWKKYLDDVINSMQVKLDGVVAAWNGNYRDEFVNSDGTGAGSSLSLMVNDYIMHFERFVRSGKFAIPGGVMSGVAAPEKVEAFYSKSLGIELASTALKAARDLYLGEAYGAGAAGGGLYSYLQALGTNNQNIATLAANISSQFDVLDNKINGLGSSVYDAIVNNRSAILELYDEFQKQVRFLKVDMTSALGITISYTDNDGD